MAVSTMQQTTSTLEVVRDSITGLWTAIISYLPQLIGAMLVFLIGIAIAVVLRRVVVKAVELLRLDDLASKLEVKKTLGQVGVRLHIGHLFGWIVKWFIVVVTLIATTDILGWDELTEYLKQVIIYIPNVIIAVVILLAGTLLANFVRNIIKSAVEAAQLSSADFLSGVAKWAILAFSFMAALVQLQIAKELIQVLFTGLVYMLALAGGLAFGLGGKDHASRVLDRLRKDISTEK